MERTFHVLYISFYYELKELIQLMMTLHGFAYISCG